MGDYRNVSLSPPLLKLSISITFLWNYLVENSYEFVQPFANS